MPVRPSLPALAAAIAALVLTVSVAAPAAAGRRDTIPPTVPTNLRTTAVTQTSVSLAWNPSTDNVGVVSYTPWATGLPLQSVPASQTWATYNGLRPNTTYVFQVQAWDGTNWSNASNLVTVTTQRETVAPTAPSGLIVADTLHGYPVDGLTASKVLLRWNSSTDQWGPISYEILVDGAVTPHAWSTRTAGTQPGALSGSWVRRLDPGTTYQIAVRARDGSGNVSGLSNTLTVTTDANGDTVAPTVPVLTRADSGGTGACPEEIWLHWIESTDNVLPPSAIEYEFRVNGTILDVVPGGYNWITYTEVFGPNAVTMHAVDQAGNASAASNTIVVTTNWGSGSGPWPCG